MSRVWKCKECVKYGTDACYNGSKYEHDNCKYKLIDIDYAYQQGRADAIEEFKPFFDEMNKCSLDWICDDLCGEFSSDETGECWCIEHCGYVIKFDCIKKWCELKREEQK